MKLSTKAVLSLMTAGAADVWIQKRKKAEAKEIFESVEIHGYVKDGFEAVREALADNFSKGARSALPAAFTTKAKKWLICGAECETSRRASCGKRARWLWFIRRPKVWRR